MGRVIYQDITAPRIACLDVKCQYESGNKLIGAYSDTDLAIQIMISKNMLNNFVKSNIHS